MLFKEKTVLLSLFLTVLALSTGTAHAAARVQRIMGHSEALEALLAKNKADYLRDQQIAREATLRAALTPKFREASTENVKILELAAALDAYCDKEAREYLAAAMLKCDQETGKAPAEQTCADVMKTLSNFLSRSRPKNASNEDFLSGKVSTPAWRAYTQVGHVIISEINRRNQAPAEAPAAARVQRIMGHIAPTATTSTTATMSAASSSSSSRHPAPVVATSVPVPMPVPVATPPVAHSRIASLMAYARRNANSFFAHARVQGFMHALRSIPRFLGIF